MIYEGKWAEVCYAIDELEWFVSRKVNLASTAPGGMMWADLMGEDIEDLRKALDEARAAETQTVGQEQK